MNEHPRDGRADGKIVLGWREHVSFPGWGIRNIEAKVDTGARTSALHVDNIKKLPNGRLRFCVVLSRKNPEKQVPVETDIVRVTRVRSSTGHQQVRYIVAARIAIGPVRKTIETSLVCRKHMLCRMLLGRTALEGEFVVDTSRKYACGQPVRKPGKKKNKSKHKRVRS